MNFLSKTAFLQYLQCPKLFWHYIHNRSVFPPTDPETEHRLKEGKQVEEHARQLFPKGILIDHEKLFSEVVVNSRAAISNAHSETPIFQSIIASENLISEIDILLPIAASEFDIYEVKSSTDIKPEFIPDVAFQKHVAEKAGLRIRKCHLIHIKSDYVRQGDLNHPRLFSIIDITEDVEEISAEIEKHIEGMKQLAALEECPQISIGLQCDDPDECPLKSICWKEINEEPNTVFSLYRIRKRKAFELYEAGVLKMGDIPGDLKLTDKQRIQVKVETTGKPHIDERGLKEFLNRLENPCYFLDFETFAAAVPLLDNSKPYQQIPFQYSLHVIRKSLDDHDEEPEHHSWIWSGSEGDPRERMLGRLKGLLGDVGSIVVYNQSFEIGRLKEAAEAYPDYQQWVQDLLPRFVDLLELFRAFHVHFPGQHGSNSMKATLPAVTGQDYSELEIQDGQTASIEFMKVLEGEVGDSGKAAILGNLEKYCGLDTLGMVEILRELKRLQIPGLDHP